MFDFPPQTRFGKAVPKTRIHAHAGTSRRVRDLFSSQVADIVWAHKLSPETLRLPAAPAVPEIQIFDLILKGESLDDEVLHIIDRAIPFPLIHRIRSADGIAYSAAYKRPSAADSSQWVVGARFASALFPVDAAFPPLPAVIDLGHLYSALFAPLLPLPPGAGEDLQMQVIRCEAYQRLSREIALLTSRLQRERQFPKKVALNQQLKPLQQQLATLRS